MDNWQAWAASIFGFILTLLSADRMHEKKRSLDRAANIYDKLDKLDNKHNNLAHRVTRVEAEIMTEREVREILAEFMTPFLARLGELNNKSDKISGQINDLRVILARGSKNEDSDI